MPAPLRASRSPPCPLRAPPRGSRARLPLLSPRSVGKVVIVLVGRFAGRKAVVLKHFEEGSKERRFGHVLVAGIERYPRKLTKKMDDAQKEARMAVKPFVKYLNLQHVMPTRSNLVSVLGRGTRRRQRLLPRAAAGRGGGLRLQKRPAHAKRDTRRRLLKPDPLPPPPRPPPPRPRRAGHLRGARADRRRRGPDGREGQGGAEGGAQGQAAGAV